MTRINLPASALLLGGLLALSACGGDAASPTEGSADGSGAAGEVEGGSINDNMLPLESVTSKAPPRGGSEEDGASDGDVASESDNAAPGEGS